MPDMQQVLEVERAADPAADALEHQERTDPMTAALRAASFEQGQDLLKPEDTLLGALFRRIDSSGDKGIERSEVIEHLKRVGIKGGFLGLVHTSVADKFMENLDVNKDAKVTMGEFGAVAQQLLPAELFDSDGRVKLDLLDEFLASVDKNSSGGISRKELDAGTLDRLPSDTSHKKKVSDVAARMGMDALDTDKSGEIDIEELKKAAEAVSSVRGSS
jgi:Ca2+-binding EF-hand superfamily protein